MFMVVEVKKPSQASKQFTVFSDESVDLNDLSLDLLPSLLEKKPSLSPLFAKSSSDKKRRRQVVSKCCQNF